MKDIGAMLDRLASFNATRMPVISLYLNAQPDQHGRDNFQSFVRKEFKAGIRTYPLRSEERLSLEQDQERISKYLRDELRSSANGVAIFACQAEGGFFEALQLDAPVDEHSLFVNHQPHLFPLARILDRHPVYAVLLADTNRARLFVFSLGATRDSSIIEGEPIGKSSVGGWSQMRYQRHIENYHMHHAKEAVEQLDTVVRQENIDRVILAGDEVILPLIHRHLSGYLRPRVVDVMRLDIRTPEHEVFRATAEALRTHEARTAEERVEMLLEQYRSGSMAVVGVRDTLAAVDAGQVDELIISSSIDEIDIDHEADDMDASPALEALVGGLEGSTRSMKIADELVTRARRTGARVSFVQNQSRLAEVGGAGAFLRFRMKPIWRDRPSGASPDQPRTKGIQP